MARHERDFRTTAEEPLSLNDLLDLLSEGGDHSAASREDAIACYLAGGDGWREAMKRLGGAFAEGSAGLKDRKGD